MSRGGGPRAVFPRSVAPEQRLRGMASARKAPPEALLRGYTPRENRPGSTPENSPCASLNRLEQRLRRGSDHTCVGEHWLMEFEDKQQTLSTSDADLHA